MKRNRVKPAAGTHPWDAGAKPAGEPAILILDLLADTPFNITGWKMRGQKLWNFSNSFLADNQTAQTGEGGVPTTANLAFGGGPG